MNSFGLCFLAYGFYSLRKGNRKKPKYPLLETKEKPIETKKPKRKGENRKAQPPTMRAVYPFDSGLALPMGNIPLFNVFNCPVTGANVKECRAENGAENVRHGAQTAVKTVKKRAFWLLIILSYQNHSPIFTPFSYLPWSFMVVQNRIFRTVSAAIIEQKSTLAHFSEAGNGEGKNNSGDCSNLKKRWCLRANKGIEEAITVYEPCPSMGTESPGR